MQLKGSILSTSSTNSLLVEKIKTIYFRLQGYPAKTAFLLGPLESVISKYHCICIGAQSFLSVSLATKCAGQIKNFSFNFSDTIGATILRTK